MKIAIEGCCHGELDKIYETLAHIESTKGVKIDLLICCGDFQAARNQIDLQSMQVPAKYRKMQSFHKYYSGQKIAPIMTIFVGGNHESSTYLWELPFGGWVCPNIYYLGHAGIISYKGLRIGGISGIYNEHHYYLEHFEIPPFNSASCRSVYHTRKIDVDKLKMIKKPIDIFFSHDWPLGIYNYGDMAELIRRKPFFKQEIGRNLLGSPCGMELLRHLRPSYWFSAHLHVKFPAIVPHECNGNKIKLTKFLALDKCLPNRDFLQILEIVESSPSTTDLSYDLEWLTILNSTHFIEKLSENDIVDIFGNDLKIPKNFERTAPTQLDKAINGNNFLSRFIKLETNERLRLIFTRLKVAPYYENLQTILFCKKLKIFNPCISRDTCNKRTVNESDANPEKIDSGVERENIACPETFRESDLNSKKSQCTSLNKNSCLNNSINPDEIAIDEV